MAYHKKSSHVPKINAALTQAGFEPLVEPIHYYENFNRGSEDVAAKDFLAKVHAEPNSPTLQHVLLVYPNEPVWEGTYTLYQPIFDSNTLVLWYTTHMINGTLGPEGTVVFNFDERSAGIFVGERFCHLSDSAPNPKRIQPLMYGYANGFLRFRGFVDGISKFCSQKGHTLLEPIMLVKETSWEDAARMVMEQVFIEDPLVDAVFCPDDDMAFGVAQAANDFRLANLSGFLLNGWQYGDSNKPYLEQGLMYADVDSSITDLDSRLSQFLARMNLQLLPRSVLSPMIFRVPSMDGLIKGELLATYNTQDKPPSSGPVQVSLDLQLEAFMHVDHEAKSFETLFTINTRWIDPRLQFSPGRHNGTLDYVKEEIWLPKTYFDNIITLRQELFYTLSSEPDGSVHLHRRLLADFKCSMDLSRFPYDKHTCAISVRSRSALDAMRLRPGDMTEAHHVEGGSGFLLGSVDASAGLTGGSHADANAVTFNIELERESSPYLISHIMPGIVFVVISMLTFWIPEGSVPARVGLGMIMLLTMTNLWASLPRVGTILDTFFITNIGFCLFIFLVSLAAYSQSLNAGLERLVCKCCKKKQLPLREAAESGSPQQELSRVSSMQTVFGSTQTRLADKFGRRVMPPLYAIVMGYVLGVKPS